MMTLRRLKIDSCTVLVGFIITLSLACSKSDSPVPEKPEPEKPGQGAIPFFKLQRVQNFSVETDDKNPTQAKNAAYFSLENKEEVKELYAKTARWDIGFNGLYNSFLSGNNGKDATNLGYGASGIGGIMIVEKPFDQVTAVPADAEFKTKGTLIGTDNLGDFGEGIGWYLYDFAGTKKGDGSYNKQHVAYALPEIRTIIVRTAAGNYAKIKMISCYKDAFTADQWFRETPHMFFTFEYVLVPKGSTKFEIK